ncbi:MAG: hypothetical protein ACOCWG_01725, partial [bacterium]
KPWHYVSIHPRKKDWWFYLKQSPVKYYKPKDKTIKNIITLPIREIIKFIKPRLTLRFKQEIGKFIPLMLKKPFKNILFKTS